MFLGILDLKFGRSGIVFNLVVFRLGFIEYYYLVYFGIFINI